MTDEEFNLALLSASARSVKPTADWLVAEGVYGWKTIHGPEETVLRLRMLADLMEQEVKRPAKPALRLVD